MRDEPDIIKELKLEEKFRTDSTKPKYQNPFLVNNSIEKDYGANPRKLFVFIITIIVIILSLFYITNIIIESDLKLNAEKNKFIGTWELEYNNYDSSISVWTFYENKTIQVTYYYYPIYDFYYSAPEITFETDNLNNSLKVTSINYGTDDFTPQYIDFGTYKIENNKLCIKRSYQSNYICYDYKFYNNNSQFTLYSYDYYSSTILNKTSASYPVISFPHAVSWDNINITVYGPINVYYDWINLIRYNTYYSYTRSISEWGDVVVGDVIEIGKYNSDINIKMMWVPTYSTIGNWHFKNSSIEPGLICN